ncbi:predicted GPI-anchored protein 58 [Drosophila navojoa]|uniref:predicted GPI-anchored protein 58 n=1 Tax=Drosophila navojoa TaxID=7232 RepID=UPI0011BD6A64|nr:predicted GPI-anchored protein 58 [Drosophila navojoa]
MRLIYLLLLLLAFYSVGSSALRCYTCEDCDEQSVLTELEVCSVPALTAEQPSATGQPGTAVSSPSAPSKPNPAPAPSPAAPAASATAPGTAGAANKPAAAPAPASSPAAASESEDEDDYDSDEEDAAPGASAGTNGAGAAAAAGAGTAAGAAAPAGAPAPAAANGESEEEEEEDEDYDYRNKRSISRQTQRQIQSTQRAVCYIASLELNGTEITNRGCTLVTNDNQSDVCKSLFDGWSVLGCTLCEYNGCNSPINAAVVGSLTGNTGNGRLSSEIPFAMTLLAVVSSLWICN